MASLLQRVRLLDGGALGAGRAFAMGTRDGAATVGVDAGVIAPERLADLVAVDLGHPSLHPPIDLLRNVVYALSPQAITDVWVHGRRVVENKRLLSVDVDDLLARVRAVTAGWRI